MRDNSNALLDIVYLEIQLMIVPSHCISNNYLNSFQSPIIKTLQIVLRVSITNILLGSKDFKKINQQKNDIGLVNIKKYKHTIQLQEEIIFLSC